MNGHCSCGNIHFHWQANRSELNLTPRMCDCSICSQFTAQFLSQPNSVLSFSCKDDSLVEIKKNGSQTADFYICQHCSELILVTSNIGGSLYAVVNGLAIEELELLAPQPVNYDHEATSDRLCRREKNWISNVSYVQ